MENNKKIFLGITILIVLAMLVLGLVMYEEYKKNKKLNIGGVEISQKNYDKINKELGKENLAYYICNIESEKCIQLINIENLEEVMNG